MNDKITDISPTKAEDAITPSYYNIFGKELHEICEKKGFYLGNALKYIIRAGQKDGSSAVQDIKKAIQNMEFWLNANARKE